MATLDELASDDGMHVTEKSELGEVFDNLDSSQVDTKTKLNAIDMNTRLSEFGVKNHLIFDELQQLGIIDHDCKLSVVSKRLNVSRDGLGRIEKVKIATASRENQLNQRGGVGGMFERMFARKDTTG